jgi:bis(5'-nucleosyl)-tetraphosphatase (symmetrical)
MTTWAIGDLHGCLDEFERLLARLDFDPARDRLWFVGDLVNRGPDSLGCLRRVRDFGDRAITVLGNHDLHLLATAAGIRRVRSKDTFDDVLDAPDRDELLDWLRLQPLLHRDQALDFTMVHAGLHRDWDLDTAARLAAEVETELRKPDCGGLFEYMYGDEPARWSDRLSGEDRIRAIINVMTRMRFCHPDGSLDLDPSGPPGSQPGDLVPWYEVPDRASAGERVVFGHWSRLGYLSTHGIHALDSGCLWGGRLTALNLDNPEEVIQVDCPGALEPGKG